MALNRQRWNGIPEIPRESGSPLIEFGEHRAFKLSAFIHSREHALDFTRVVARRRCIFLVNEFPARNMTLGRRQGYNRVYFCAEFHAATALHRDNLGNRAPVMEPSDKFAFNGFAGASLILKGGPRAGRNF